MRSADPLFETYLETTNEFIIADLYTFTLKSGEVLRLTSWDVSLSVSGNSFSAAGALISRSSIKQSIGVDADDCNVTLLAQLSNTLADGTPILQALKDGRFRGADVIIQRLYMQTAGVVTFAPINWFVGQVGAVEVDNLSSTLNIRSSLYILDKKLPKNTIQPSCRYVLFDTSCTLSKAAFVVAKTVAAGSTALRVNATSAISQPDDYFTQGTIVFTSGANAGLSRSIRQHTASTLYLNVAFPFVVNAGDAFNLYPGCDKKMATCDTKFANLVNFGGEPFVPPPETAL